MKKFVIMFAVMMIALGASAYATEVRTMTMGLNDGIMVDDYNVFRFYGRILNYPNIATAEFSSYDYIDKASTVYGERDEFYKFGVNWEFNQDNPWVLGTYVSTEYPVMPPIYYYYDYYLPLDMGDMSNRKLDLLYGRTLSNMNFGLHLNYNQMGYKDKDPGSQAQQSLHYIQVGAGLTEALTGKWDVAATFGFGGWTDKDPDGVKESEPDGYYDLTLEGRYFWVQNPKITFVPHASVWMNKSGFKSYYEGELDETHTLSETAFELGMGMNYVTGPDLLAVLDFGFTYVNDKFEHEYVINEDSTATYEVKTKYLYLPYVQIGVEGSVFDWMDIRFGATSYWLTESEEDDYSLTYAENATYLGFGFHFGRLHVDTYADPELFMDGFNFISGANDNHMNLEISALYELF